MDPYNVKSARGSPRRCVIRRAVVRKIMQSTESVNGVTFPSFTSARAIADEYETRTGNGRPSVWTVRRDLHSLGAVPRVRRYVPCADPRVLAKRRHFAQQWRMEKSHTTKLVTFSDEHQLTTNDYTCRTMWVIDKSDILYRLRKRDQNCVRIHLWAAIGVGFKSELVVFPQKQQCIGKRGGVCFKLYRVTAVEYTERCLKTLQRDAAFRGRVFLQDNARIHTAKHTTRKLQDMGWKVVEDFPPYSPDLNPIEMLWAVLNRRVAELHPVTLSELTDAAVSVWKALQQSEVDSFCRSWQVALQRCVSRRGRP
jgi:transposase